MRGSSYAVLVLALPIACGRVLTVDDAVATNDGGPPFSDASSSTSTEAGLEKPFPMASSRRSPAGLATDDVHIFWSEAVTNGSIFSCPLAGCEGAPTEFVKSQAAPNQILSYGNGNGIGFINSGTGTFWWGGNGGNVVECAVPVFTPVALRHAAATAFVFTAANGLFACSEAIACAAGCGHPGSFSTIAAGDVDSTAFYVATGSEIRSCPLAANCELSSSARVTTTGSQVRDLVVGDVDVFWADDAVGTVFAAPKNGADAGVARSVLANLRHPLKLRVDGTNLYVLDRGTGDDGALVRVPTKGGDGVVLAPGLAHPSDLIVAGPYVYFSVAGASDGAGAILRASK